MDLHTLHQTLVVVVADKVVKSSVPLGKYHAKLIETKSPQRIDE